MKKRFLCLLLALIFCLGCCAPALAAGLPSHDELAALPQEPFDDVGQDQWYYEDVMLARSAGLVDGVGRNLFAPQRNISVAEVLKLAVLTWELYHGEEGEPPSASESPAAVEALSDSPSPAEDVSPVSPMDVPEEEPEAPSESPAPEKWYDPYVAQALSRGILSAPLDNYEVSATRAFAAELLYRALPETALPAINNITSLPDVPENHEHYRAILTLYQAGVLSGNNKYGEFRPETTIVRCELTAILMRLILPERRLSVTLTPWYDLETIVYGKSGAGRDLIAYRLGNGENVLMMSFAIHGFEDNWARDGEELVWLAEQLKAELAKDSVYGQLIRDKNWTVYILPCLNPDGLYDGTTNNGPGRCTTYYINAAGVSVYGGGKVGVDLNRCFPRGFKVLTNARNYTTSQPLAAVEARAIDAFVQSRKSSTGQNVFLDVHGWTQQIISSTGANGRLSKIFAAQFPANRPTALGGQGYLSGYTAQLGYHSCLFEFPSAVYNHKGFLKYSGRFIQCVKTLLETYV